MLTKYKIFEHLTNLSLANGNAGGFYTENSINKIVISKLPNLIFNYVSLGELNDELIENLKQQNIPFMCLPQQNVEKDFVAFAIKHNLTFGGDMLAHEFENLNMWNYTPGSHVEIREIFDIADLQKFDEISSTAFHFPKGLGQKYLAPVLGSPGYKLYLAWKEDKAVGCGVLAFIDNQAGLYWDGLLPEYRAQGIGSELTKYRMNIAKLNNHQTIIVQNMAPSVKYYQKIGFKPAGALPIYTFEEN